MKKILFFLILLLSLFIINNFIQSIYRLWQKQDLITTAREELKELQTENKTLKRQKEQVTQPSFIESEARNKLFLVKPGEEVIILPQPSQTPSQIKTTQKTGKPLAAWQQWYQLFF